MGQTTQVSVIDVETSQNFSAKYNPICAIAVCQIDINNFGLIDIKKLEKFLVKPPNNDIAKETIAIHNITPDMTANAPSFKTLWPKLASLIEGNVLVAHNADFDFAILEKELEVAGIESPSNQYVCTLDIARKALPNEERHGLSYLAEKFDIPLDHHDPASDAKATASLLEIMMRHKGRINPQALSTFLGIPVGILGSPPRWPDGVRPYEREPHFRKYKGKWAIATLPGILKEGRIVTVTRKSGEVSLIEIEGNLKEVTTSAGGTLVCALKYKDVTEEPEHQLLRGFEDF